MKRDPMPKPKKRTASPPINRAALIAGVLSMSYTFTWHELIFVIGSLGSESQLRHILFDEWKWVEPTNDTQPTTILRKGKYVGGRPQIMYGKTAAGKAGVLPVATVRV